MIKVFKPKEESDALRIYKIYKSVDINERIDHIVHSEYNRMLYMAEKAALSGRTSLIFDVSIEERDEIHFNMIIDAFTTKLRNNGFRYNRQMIVNKNRFTIYFFNI